MVLCLVFPTGLQADNFTGWNTLGGNNQRNGMISEDNKLKGCGHRFLWKFQIKDSFVYSPTVNDEFVIFGNNKKSVYCLDRKSGDEIWNKELAGNSFYQAIHDGKLFLGDSSGMFSCLNLSNGKLIWEYDVHQSIVSCPIVSDDCVFFVSKDWYLYCLTLGGKLKWKFRTENCIFSSPVKSENNIFVVSEDRHVYCINADTGTLKWKRNVGSPSADADHKSMPAIHDGKIFIGLKLRGIGSYGVTCLDASTGELMWQTKMPDRTYSFAISDNRLFTGCENGLFFCLNIDDGKIIWNFKTNNRIVDSPVADDKYVLVPS